MIIGFFRCVRPYPLLATLHEFGEAAAPLDFVVVVVDFLIGQRSLYVRLVVLRVVHGPAALRFARKVARLITVHIGSKVLLARIHFKVSAAPRCCFESKSVPLFLVISNLLSFAFVADLVQVDLSQFLLLMNR